MRIDVTSRETVTMPKKEYLRLKKLEEVDCELVGKFKDSLDDLKMDKISRVR